jgi:ligand-binding SRPBCC domain-containing protein
MAPKPCVSHLHREMWVPLPLETVFAFFSNPSNLERVTPPWVGFRILSKLPLEMKRGLLLDYAIRVHGIPLKWRSEITVWEPPFRFADLQIQGPYAVWHHEHRFEARHGGTLVTDAVEYAIPFSWMPGSGLVERFLVRPDLEKIFDHRRGALLRHFGLPDTPPEVQGPDLFPAKPSAPQKGPQPSTSGETQTHPPTDSP